MMAMPCESRMGMFQSALRFAVVSDKELGSQAGSLGTVSIRFEVRGGFRHAPL